MFAKRDKHDPSTSGHNNEATAEIDFTRSIAAIDGTNLKACRSMAVTPESTRLSCSREGAKSSNYK